MLHLLLFMAFTYYKTVTIDHTQCGIVDSTDFPVAIWVTDADLKTVANGGKVQNSSGYDIRPFSDSGLTIALTYELVASTYVATTGAVEMHVKIPTVSASSDTLFYLAFGDSGISTDGSSTATWSNGFIAVYHLGPGSGTLSVTDSVGSFNATNNSATATTGQIDGGAAVSFSPNKYLSTPTHAAVSSLSAFTMSFWGNRTTAGIGLPQIMVGNIVGYPDRVEIAYYFDDNIYYVIDNHGVGPNSLFVASGGVTGFNHFAMAFDGGLSEAARIKGFLNGNSQTLSGGTGINPTTTPPDQGAGLSDINIGITDFTIDGAGILDEVRLESVARSANWITAQYNNEKPSSTFLAYGALTPIGTTGKLFFLIPN
jgi:hypothetical protein